MDTITISKEFLEKIILALVIECRDKYWEGYTTYLGAITDTLHDIETGRFIDIDKEDRIVTKEIIDYMEQNDE